MKTSEDTIIKRENIYIYIGTINGLEQFSQGFPPSRCRRFYLQETCLCLLNT